MSPHAERYRVPRGLPNRQTQFMEANQGAWLRAVAAASGAIVMTYEVIDDGIDAMLHHRHDSHTAIPDAYRSTSPAAEGDDERGVDQRPSQGAGFALSSA